jgi:hypothetical protein
MLCSRRLLTVFSISLATVAKRRTCCTATVEGYPARIMMERCNGRWDAAGAGTVAPGAGGERCVIGATAGISGFPTKTLGNCVGSMSTNWRTIWKSGTAYAKQSYWRKQELWHEV